MADVGIAMSKAEEKTEKMKAKSQALDEMIDSGVLTDYTSDTNEEGGIIIEKELEDVASRESVEQELAKLKAERSKKKKLGDRRDDGVEEQEAEQVQQAAT
jgi:phage shock protein A